MICFAYQSLRAPLATQRFFREQSLSSSGRLVRTVAQCVCRCRCSYVRASERVCVRASERACNVVAGSNAADRKLSFHGSFVAHDYDDDDDDDEIDTKKI